MTLIEYELKKIIKTPMLIFLILVFLAFNISFIISNRYNAYEINDINHIAGIIGIEINEDFYTNFSKIYEKRYGQFIKLYIDKTNKDIDIPDKMLEEIYRIRDLSKEEEQVLDEFALINFLDYEIKNLEDIYINMNAKKTADEQIEMYRIGGTAKDLVYKKSALIQERIDEIIENNEGYHLFFPGKVYLRHSFVFKELFKFLTIETMLMAILVTLTSINNEYVKRTDQLIFSTKTGRNLLKCKFKSSILASISAFIILASITFIVHFIVFNYSNVLDVPVTSILNAEPSMEGLKPVLTWHKMTYLEYFIGSLIVVLSLSIIYSMVTFVVSNFSKNSFISFSIIMLIFGIGINLVAIFPLDKAFTLFTNLNPFALTLYFGAWFTDGGSFMPVPYFETVIIIVWIILMSIFSLYTNKHFMKKDLL